MKQVIFTLILGILVNAAVAQTELLKVTGTEGIIRGAVSVVDMNADGNMDVIFSGRNETNTSSVLANKVAVYHGLGNGNFNLIGDLGLKGGSFPCFSWEDFNGDGRLDLYNTGYLAGADNAYMQQYLASTDTEFSLTESNPFPVKPTKIYGQQSAVADFDNDGLLDFVHIYQAQTVKHIVRFQDVDNDSVVFQLPLTKMNGTTLATQMNGARITLVDFNHDGFVDFLVTGHIAFPTPVEKYGALFLNNRDRTFTEQKFTEFIAGNGATDLFADINGDGEWDLVSSVAVGSTVGYPLSYYVQESGELKLQRTFTEQYKTGSSATGTIFGAIADLNNDGYYDFIFTGLVGTAKKVGCYIYNPGTQDFDLNTTLADAVTGLDYPSLAVIDANNDGILDFAMMGQDATATNTYVVYQNTIFTATNTPPTVPGNLTNSVNASKVTFTWEAASDDKTPSASLTYNLYLKNVTTGKYVIFPKANLTNGKRQVHEHGNAYMAKTKTMTLPDGEYEWSVQAVDAAYAGGQFAEIKSFIIGDLTKDIVGNADDIHLTIGNGYIMINDRTDVELIELYSTTGSLLKTVRNNQSISFQTIPGIYVVKATIGGNDFVKKVVF